MGKETREEGVKEGPRRGGGGGGGGSGGERRGAGGVGGALWDRAYQ